MLDFSDAVAPPKLGETTYASTRAASLKIDLTQLLVMEQPVYAREDLVLRVRINCHRIAIDLLERSENAGETSSIVMLAALRFAQGFETLTETLEKVLTDPRMEDARAALARFNEQATARLAQLDASERGLFEESLRDCLHFLTEAVGLIEGAWASSQWILAPGEASQVDERTAETRLAMLVQRLEQSKIDDETRSAIFGNLDYLQRGLSFEEFRPQVSRYLETVDLLVSFVEAMESADWLDSKDVALYADRIRRVAVWFGDPDRREQAITLTQRLSISGEMFSRISELDRYKIDLRTMRAAIAEAEALMDVEDDAGDGRDRIERLLELIQPMLAYRELPHPELPREIRSVRKAMQDSYERAEHAVIDSLDRLLSDPLASADPALGSLLQHQLNVIADLERLNKIRNWVEIVGRIRSRSERPVVRRIRIVSGWLIEPARRDKAAALFDALESHLTRFERLPLEDELGAESIELAGLTGGLNAALLGKIKAARTRWIELLGSDLSGGASARRLDRLERICKAMHAFRQLGEVQQEAVLLNRWTPWMLEPGVIEQPLREMPLRFKLAVAAAVNDNEADLVAQLEMIESELPLLELLHAIAHARHSELEALSDGAPGMLGALTVPPPPEGGAVWLIDHRETLTELCRYAHEREQARNGGSSELAGTISGYVNQLARQLQVLIEVEPSAGSTVQ